MLTQKREASMTQREMAERLGIAQSTVAKLELRDAAFVRLGDLFRYAAALGVTIHIRAD